jgi:pimeloyl-ACP methyl ester carboxylesterase
MRLFYLLYPLEWLSKQPPFSKWFPMPKETSSTANVERQVQAMASWPGTFNRLDKIKSPTSMVTGMEDILTPPENSMILASRINGSWLVRIEGAGHGLMYQYPDKLAKVVTDFIEISTSTNRRGSAPSTLRAKTEGSI